MIYQLIPQRRRREVIPPDQLVPPERTLVVLGTGDVVSVREAERMRPQPAFVVYDERVVPFLEEVLVVPLFHLVGAVQRGRHGLGVVVLRLYDYVLNVVAVAEGARGLGDVFFEIVVVDGHVPPVVAAPLRIHVGAVHVAFVEAARAGGALGFHAIGDTAVSADGGYVVAAVCVLVKGGLHLELLGRRALGEAYGDVFAGVEG